MQVSLVMMFALTGLGCQNMPADAVNAGAVTSYQTNSPPWSSDQGTGYPIAAYTGSFAGTPYPEIPSRLYPRYSQPHTVDWHAELRSTLYSFVCGHDPDISTVRDIEAAVYGPDPGY